MPRFLKLGIRKFGLLLTLGGMFLAGSANGTGLGNAVDPTAIMPGPKDRTSMWWANGFPSRSKNAAWHRCIQTGHYGLVLDTLEMQFPHLGPISSRESFAALPPARLQLVATVDGKQYVCTAGGPWTKHGGPRLIESGRFFQRCDVTHLVFKAKDGEVLNADARFEIAAWPDRLGMILAVRPEKSRPGKSQSGKTLAGKTQAWKNASLSIGLRGPLGALAETRALSDENPATVSQWHQVSLAFDPSTFEIIAPTRQVQIQATEMKTGKSRSVQYDPVIGWHRVNLDGISPNMPRLDRVGSDRNRDRRNDAIERIKLVLSNPTNQEQVARMMFEKSSGRFAGRVGSAITGVSAILRDASGNPTGIPVQLSKNWHDDPAAGIYRGAWFHGITQVRLPSRTNVELELTIVNGHWGGVAAASHAQLCLIGWGSNQLWEQSALGAWGESICYEPDQVQANCSITDVRPAMVAGMKDGMQWKWTSNVGGGDYFRMFDQAGDRVPHAAMKTTRHRQGPCLTEVTYAGRLGKKITQQATVSLARTDDLVRGTYRLRMDVKKATDVSRLVIFQIGADTYSYTSERKMAIGDASGLQKEWNTQWGGNKYRTDPIECTGVAPWMSLHDAVDRKQSSKQGAWANRGIVIRSWNARIGGKTASPWIAERGVTARRNETSTLDIITPPGTSRLMPGDFVEATIEHIVMPQFARDYYGPNDDLRKALGQHENTWRMIHRESAKGDRKVQVSVGEIQRTFPDIRVKAVDDEARLTLSGGIGYVPITFTDLSSAKGFVLVVNGQPMDQSVHGNDFWQTDFDPITKRWSQTFNLPAVIDGRQEIHFHPHDEAAL